MRANAVALSAVFGALGAFGFPGGRLAAENWPCFRGPSRQGVSSETGLSLRWSRTEGVLWKTPIPGEAWSSPIVWEDRVFVTTAAEGGKSCRVISLDAATGKILWDKEVVRQEPPSKHPRNTHATPTPATDGERVYAAFGDGSVVAVDFAGAIVWTNRDFPYRSQHGMATSPILWEGLLIQARDPSGEGDDELIGWQIPWDKSYVLALDAKTGAVRWKAPRGLSRIGHVTPNLWTAPDGKVQVVSGAGNVVQGFDARTGERIWTSKNIGEGVVPSIVIGEGLAFAACGFGGREAIRAFRLGEKGDLGETNVAWERRKGMPKVPSFLYLAPHLYAVDDGGLAACLVARTGEVVWEERLGGAHSASPVGADGRVYFLSDDGETTVVEAGPAFKVLARNPLGEKTQASMAVSGGRLFIRTAQHLWSLGK